ncbi:MAG: hypothetical protein MPW14_26040 (plasmid) [Candidatus Manganitrophus sp.]|nr:MAG: hypothetical protein MPW14_26040 [Candidatus Manganitrophus sp.]
MSSDSRFSARGPNSVGAGPFSKTGGGAEDGRSGFFHHRRERRRPPAGDPDRPLPLPGPRPFPEVIAKPRDCASEQSAQEALLEVALGLSPIIENAESGCVYLDLRGVRDESALLEEAVSASATMGLPARAAVAGGRVTARIAARRAEEGPAIIPEGGDAAFLAPLSLATLSPPSPCSIG